MDQQREVRWGDLPVQTLMWLKRALVSNFPRMTFQLGLLLIAQGNHFVRVCTSSCRETQRQTTCFGYRSFMGVMQLPFSPARSKPVSELRGLLGPKCFWLGCKLPPQKKGGAVGRLDIYGSMCSRIGKNPLSHLLFAGS